MREARRGRSNGRIWARRSSSVDDIAYVTEPASEAIHAADLTTGKVVASATLNITLNEIARGAG